MNIRILLPLLTALFFLGCAAVPTPKYTVLTAPEPRALPAGYTALTVRLADDIRSAPNPLCFHADGTVTLCRELTYYAPVEVAITRALQDAFVRRKESLPARKPLRLTVRTFGVDARDATPKAVVRLDFPAEQLDVRSEEPLPAAYTARELRDALGKALLRSMERACDAIALPADAK